MILLGKTTPHSIREHRYSWLFVPEWQMIHNRMDGNSFTFFIGMTGSGKTYAALSRAQTMGVDEHGDSSFLFNWDHLENHVFWDKAKLLTKIRDLEKLPARKIRGYQLILDEAQKSANAKEWNDREVLEFSKEMTTIRSSRLNICLTMPTYKMITTDLRQMGTYQAEMLPPETMNRSEGYSFCKLHLLELKPFISEVWRRRPYLHIKQISPITGLPVVHQGLLSRFRWELPDKTIRKNYEELKKAFRRESSEERAAAAEVEIAAKSKRMGFKEGLAFVRAHLDRFIGNNGKVVPGLIAADDIVGLDTAKQIAATINRRDIGV